MSTVIVKRNIETGEEFYLNHSTMSSLSFGSPEMAWNTNDLDIAEMMMARCIEKHNDEAEYEYDLETVYL